MLLTVLKQAKLFFNVYTQTQSPPDKPPSVDDDTRRPLDHGTKSKHRP